MKLEELKEKEGVVVEGKVLSRYEDKAIAPNGVVKLPEGLEEIGRECFMNSTKLSELILPKSLKKLAWGSLARCEKLRKIELNEGLEVLDDYALLGSSSLETIKLPKSVQFIGNGSLSALGCAIEVAEDNPYFMASEGVLFNKDKTKLLACPDIKETYTTPNSVEELAWSAFRGCRKLKQLLISEGVRILGEDACYDCANLEEVRLADSVEEIGWLAFSRCKSLRSISIPAKVKSLGWALFSDCRLLEEVHLSEGLETIGLATFAHCHSLEHITLPRSLKEIGGGAFSDCPKLTTISCLAEQPPRVDDFDFRGKLLVPKGSSPSYREAIAWRHCSPIEEIS